MAVRFIQRIDGTPGVPPQDTIVNFPVNFTATAGTPVDGIVFIADQDYEIVKIIEVHSTAGAGSTTLDIKKCTGTTAPASGTSVLATASSFLTDSTVNIPITKTTQGTTVGTTFTASATTGITQTQATRRLAVSDRIALDFTGTQTAYIGNVQIHLRRLQSANDQVGF